MEIDFSEYKIYIDDSGCMGSLIPPNDNSPYFEKKFIYSFDEGIKKLQEEKRGIYWIGGLQNDKMVEYFKNTYNIYVS